MPVLPSSLVAILSLLRPAFTAPSFENFLVLVHGFLGRVGEHTITGVWQAARLAGRLHHSRAHRFFSRACWSADRLGLLLLDFLIERFVPAGEPLRLAVDSTVFRRSGRKVHATAWLYDGAGPPGQRSLRFGNAFVVVGLVVRLPGLGERPWCLPLLFRLWVPAAKAKRSASKVAPRTQPELARELVELVAERHPGRPVELTGDGAFACRALAGLPEQVTLTTRIRKSAVLFAPPPRRPPGQRGRPRKKGKRLGSVDELAAAPASRWRIAEVPGRGAARVLQADGLWYSVWGSQPVQLVIARERPDRHGFRLAIVSTDLEASPAELLARYAARWSIEMCFHDAKSLVGVGEARNRTPRAVERTVPFGFLAQTIAIAWYALNGDPTSDVQRRRQQAPWYPAKHDPSTADVLASLRRELIKAEFRAAAHPNSKPRKNAQPANPPRRTAA